MPVQADKVIEIMLRCTSPFMALLYGPAVRCKLDLNK